MCACCHGPGDGSDVLLVPGGVADKQIVESLRGQVNGLWCSVAHDALKTRVGCEDAPDNGDAAQRLGSKAYPLPASTGNYLADVLVEQVEIEVGERHGMAAEDFLVVGVVVLARVYGCARLMYRNGAARRISRRGFVSLSSFQFLIPHGRSFLLACATLPAQEYKFARMVIIRLTAQASLLVQSVQS